MKKTYDFEQNQYVYNLTLIIKNPSKFDAKKSIIIAPYAMIKNLKIQHLQLF